MESFQSWPPRIPSFQKMQLLPGSPGTLALGVLLLASSPRAGNAHTTWPRDSTQAQAPASPASQVSDSPGMSGLVRPMSDDPRDPEQGPRGNAKKSEGR